jgi:hypothetical protein
MTNDELKLMVHLLPFYANHFKLHPQSLIAKIFGVFTVEVSGIEPVCIMLMENTL